MMMLTIIVIIIIVNSPKLSKLSNLNWVWNLCLAKSIFFYPNQTGIGLENPTHFNVYLFQTKLDLVWKRTLK